MYRSQIYGWEHYQNSQGEREVNKLYPFMLGCLIEQCYDFYEISSHEILMEEYIYI